MNHTQNNRKPKENDAAYISLEKHYYDQIFYNQENQIVHNPYEQEMRMLTSIERGDPNATQKAIDEEEEISRYVGALSDDPLRHVKNIGIVNVSTASRAAIRGACIMRRRLR